MSKVATRFAPSPTGALHIGGVRTALFKWLYSKNQKGTFHLRIEDTDKERSKDEYKIQIIKSLKWIGIEHDGDEYIQSTKTSDHINVANELLKNGHAYKCYCSNEEIEEQKKRARQKKLPYVYNRKWRDLPESDAPKDIKPVIRFKSKIEGTSVLKDLVQGDVEIENIPHTQEILIAEANKKGTEVFVATNLLESMLISSTPTRAEVNDVYHSLKSGADGLVLAAETAIGLNPIKATSMIRKLISNFNESITNKSSISTNQTKGIQPHGNGNLNINLASNSEINEIIKLSKRK